MERRRRRRLALVPVSYFQWPLLAVVALGPGPPGLLALGRDEHEQTGPPSRVSTTLEFHARHCQRQPHAGRTKAPSHVPDNLEHVDTRAGGAALGLGNSQQQHARARGSSRIITSLSVYCPRRPRERSSGAASIRPHDAAGLSGPPRTPATSFPSPVWTPAGHVGRRRIAPGPRRNPASVYAGPVPARHVGDMASRGAAPPR